MRQHGGWCGWWWGQLIGPPSLRRLAPCSLAPLSPSAPAQQAFPSPIGGWQGLPCKRSSQLITRPVRSTTRSSRRTMSQIFLAAATLVLALQGGQGSQQGSQPAAGLGGLLGGAEGLKGRGVGDGDFCRLVSSLRALWLGSPLPPLIYCVPAAHAHTRKRQPAAGSADLWQHTQTHAGCAAQQGGNATAPTTYSRFALRSSNLTVVPALVEDEVRAAGW